ISIELNCIAQSLFRKSEHGLPGNICFSEPRLVRLISYGQMTKSHLSTRFEQAPAFVVFAKCELYERFVVMRFGIVRVEFKSPLEALERLCITIGLVVDFAKSDPCRLVVGCESGRLIKIGNCESVLPHIRLDGSQADQSGDRSWLQFQSLFVRLTRLFVTLELEATIATPDPGGGQRRPKC